MEEEPATTEDNKDLRFLLPTSEDMKPHIIIIAQAELRSCVKVEVAPPGLPSLISLRFLWT